MELYPIKDADGYFVSKDGRVWSVRDYHGGRGVIPHEIKQRVRDGYRFVCLYLAPNQQVSRFVHSLVLTAIRGERPNGCDASHIDGNRANNNIDNLVWESRSANHLRKRGHGTSRCGSANHMTQLSEADVRAIKEALKTGVKQRELAILYRVSEGCISDIKRGKRWTHV